MSTAGSNRRDARPSLLWSLGVGLTAIGICYVFRSAIFHKDDAFITYQFARQIADGHGYVYHLAFAPLQGSSSPLHVTVLAVLGALTPLPLDEIGYALGALGAGLLAAVLFRAQTQAAATPGSNLLAAAACATFLVPAWLSFGLETVWAGLMLAACAIAVAQARLGWAVWASVAMVLVRPDWGWFVPPLALLAGLRIGWRSVVWFAAPAFVLLLYFLLGWLYFGEALPYSWIAKLEIPAEVSGTVSWLRFAQSFEGVAVLLCFCVAAALAGWVSGRRAGERSFLLTALLVLLCWSLLYTAVLAWKGAPNMPWYYVSTVVIAGLAAMTGIAQLRAAPRAAALALFVAVNGAGLWSISDAFSTGIDRRGHADRREHAGRWLAANDAAAGTRSVVAYEVGKIAYYSGARVYDVLGLVSREGVEGMKRKDPGLLVRTLRPDYVIGCECPGYLPMAFSQGPTFGKEYELVFSKDDYRVWRRRAD